MTTTSRVRTMMIRRAWSVWLLTAVVAAGAQGVAAQTRPANQSAAAQAEFQARLDKTYLRQLGF